MAPAGGANQLQQIFRPLNSTVAPILGWDPPQVLMDEGHPSGGSHSLRPLSTCTFSLDNKVTSDVQQSLTFEPPFTFKRYADARLSKHGKSFKNRPVPKVPGQPR